MNYKERKSSIIIFDLNYNRRLFSVEFLSLRVMLNDTGTSRFLSRILNETNYIAEAG